MLALAAESTPIGQPIPFNHKVHSDAAHLKCNDCHKLAASGEVLSIPAGKSCMVCHATIAANSPEIRELKEYVNDKQSVPWVRVYELPSFVEFSHKTHLDAGAKCETCHGPVAKRERLSRETDLSMGSCLSCHRAKSANTDCHTCHDLDE